MFQHHPDAISLSNDDSMFMSKVPATVPLYIQHPELKIIQLTEVPPPPRPDASFALTASSFVSSSYSSSTDESEEESVCSSYCSSDPEEEARVSVPDDTYKTRLHRVLVWREELAKAMGTPLPGSSLSARLSWRVV